MNYYHMKFLYIIIFREFKLWKQFLYRDIDKYYTLKYISGKLLRQQSKHLFKKKHVIENVSVQNCGYRWFLIFCAIGILYCIVRFLITFYRKFKFLNLKKKCMHMLYIREGSVTPCLFGIKNWILLCENFY